MRSSLFSSRSMKVETQTIPRSPSVMKSPNAASPTVTPSFMKSTASSISKLSPRVLNKNSPSDPSSTEQYDTVEKLTQDLIRFTRSSDRRMLIRTLKECTLLQNIPIDDNIFNAEYPNSTEAWDELKMDVIQNIPLELNGVLLGTTTSSSSDNEKRLEGEKVIQLLPLLCNKLVHGIHMDENNNTQKRITSDELYHTLLLRLSQKRNSTITFAQVNKILGNKDLALQVPKRPIKPLQHSNLVVYISDNSIHAIMEHQYAIGLFRKSDSAGRPWIGLTASIRERINISTNQAVRNINLQIHEEKATVY